MKLKTKKVREYSEEERKKLELMDNFESFVYRVHDGDTISVRVPDFDFLTPLRFEGTNAPELSEAGGMKARDYLENRLIKKKVTIILGKQKEEKWGRMLGRVMSDGAFMDEEMIALSLSTPFDRRDDGKFPGESEAFEEEKMNKQTAERIIWKGGKL